VNPRAAKEIVMKPHPVTPNSSTPSSAPRWFRPASLKTPRARLVATALALTCLSVAAALLLAGRDEPDEPLALSGRVWGPGEAPAAARPGKRNATSDAATFVDQIKDSLVRTTPGEAEKILSDAGFKGAVAREYEAGGAGAVSVAMQLRDSDAATSVLEWSNKDALSPCPGECNVDITAFDVKDIPEARGVKRLREQGAQGAGPSNPFESYEISFVDGHVLYVLRTEADPGTSDRNALVHAARQLYGRVKGRPLP
jgi:hypothetical protein